LLQPFRPTLATPFALSTLRGLGFVGNAIGGKGMRRIRFLTMFENFHDNLGKETGRLERRPS
jgi:hypothetical protein